jgi:hypothetical protein
VLAPPSIAPAPVAPLAIPVATPASPSSTFAFDEAEPGPAPARRSRRRGGWWKGPAVLVCALALAGVVATVSAPRLKGLWDEPAPSAVAEHKPKPTQADAPRPTPRERPVVKGPTGGPRKPAPPDKGPRPTPVKPRPKPPIVKNPPGDPPRAPVRPPVRPPKSTPRVFPRRALVISVNNYLYANPIQDAGPRAPSSVGGLRRALSSDDPRTGGLHVPDNQIVVLSDVAAGPKEQRPPLKSVIEKTLTSFLQTSRRQDRIMVFFIGHAVEVGGEAHLVPMGGELTDAASLIPLKWVYEQLAKCQATQKILVLDGNRINPAQGLERPSAGKMSAKFSAALATPPAGVQVWSSCVADQESLVSDDHPLGLFLDSLRLALVHSDPRQRALEGVIQKPDDPIPVEKLSEGVSKLMAAELARRKFTQTARLSGKAPATLVASDKAEPPPPKLNLPTVAPGDAEGVKEVLAEISVPPLKPGSDDDVDLAFSILPAFMADKRKDYEPQAAPDSKLRVAVHKARVALWAVSHAPPPTDLAGEVTAFRQKVKVDLSSMRESYRAPPPGPEEDRFKDRVFNDGKEMSRIVSELEDVLKELKEAGEGKDKEPKRWQAHYDFMLARFLGADGLPGGVPGLAGPDAQGVPPAGPEHPQRLAAGVADRPPG